MEASDEMAIKWQIQSRSANVRLRRTSRSRQLHFDRGRLQQKSAVFSIFRLYILTLPPLSYLIEATGLETFLFRKFLCIERTISHVAKENEYVDDDYFHFTRCHLPYVCLLSRFSLLESKLNIYVPKCASIILRSRVLGINIVTYLYLPYIPRSLHPLDYYFIS